MNIWKKLKSEKPKGFFILAPMADVTDNPFRRIINEMGRPDLFFTEFASVDGLSNKVAREKIIKKILTFNKDQKPIIAQLFGGQAENFYKAAKICRKLGFSGIDINMGCPQRNIVKQKAGVDLVRNYETAKKIFLATKQGSKASFFFGRDLAVSVKTRLGFNRIDMNWIKEVLSWKPDALIIHLRTKKEMSKIPAHWELMGEVRELRDKISPQTVLIGNGDVLSLKEGREKIKKYQIDGIMIGRGIFQNPSLFAEKDWENFSIRGKINLAIKHTKYFDEEFPKNKEGKRNKNFALLKKFFKIYINGFSGAKELRMKLMKINSVEELEKICYNYKINKN